MLTMLKLGGSLITNKHEDRDFRHEVMLRLAQEVSQALTHHPEMRLLIGHGSGSFGHFVARRYDTIHGVETPEQWRGFAAVATSAAELNGLVARSLHVSGVPVFRFQPSASLKVRGGFIINMAMSGIRTALEHHLVPLVYGDVAFDLTKGGTIVSTEMLFQFLVQQLPVERVILLGDVDGVLDGSEAIIPEITPQNFEALRPALGGSSGVDVTGGMLTKVQDMIAMVRSRPGLQVRIANGLEEGLLPRLLSGEAEAGTLIQA